MFDLGAIEMLIIGVVAIIVVGPDELPKMLRTFGRFVSKMRGMAGEFRSMFEEAARDTGVDDIARSVSDVKNFSFTNSVADGVGKALDPAAEDLEEIKRDLAADASKDAARKGDETTAKSTSGPEAASEGPKGKTSAEAAEPEAATKTTG